MPALKAPLLDTTVAANTRRRIWRNPELKSHSLLVLTLGKVYLAPLTGAPKSEVVESAESGADLDELFGPLATAVDLTAVRRVKLDLLTNSLVVDHGGPGGGSRQLTVVFATPEAADACFTRVWRRLGEGFALAPYKRDSWALARAPLVLLGAILAITGALALAANVAEDFAAARAAAVSVPAAGELGTPVTVHKTPFDTLVGWLNWRVVCGVGGAAAAVVQVWLYRRLTQPPVRLELTRT